MKVVYVSYDGLREPLGQSQVLPYLRGLADCGHEIDLITFEKPGSALGLRERLHPGLRWTGLRYHKEPTVPATAFDMVQGAATVLLRRILGRVDIVHTRSYVAGALVQPFLRASNTRFLFDMRGLWADERVEDGRWSADGRIFQGAKKVERILVSRANAITVLTNSMQQFLRHEAELRHDIKAPIWVIPTCTDLRKFSLEVPPTPRLAGRLNGSTPLVYSGSFGGRYLSTEMAMFYLEFRKHVERPKFLVVSKMEPVEIRARLTAADVEEELIWESASYDEVPAFLRCGAAGVVFHPPSFTSRGVAPTKLGEMLACGLPCAGNLVGDVPRVLSEPGAGVVLSSFDADSLESAARQLAGLLRQPETQGQANAAATRWFSLEAGVRAYDELYRSMMSNTEGGPDLGWPRPDA